MPPPHRHLPQCQPLANLENAHMKPSSVSPPLYHRLVAVITWIGVVVGFTCLYLGLKTVDFDLDAMTDPLNQLRRASMEKADLIEWSMLCDIFGFYLLMIPGVIYIWYWLRDRNPFLMAISTVSMLLYILTGALGGGILSILWPSIVRAYVGASSDPVMSQILTEQFKLVTNLVYTGMWGRVEYILIAVWVAAVSALTWSDKRAFSIFGYIGALGSLLSAVGETFSIRGLADNAINVYMIGVPLWVAWAAMFAWKAGKVPAKIWAPEVSVAEAKS